MEAKRIYKGKDGDMISRIHLVMSFFNKHLADFTAFDPHFDINYYNNWLSAYEGMAEFYDLDGYELRLQNILVGYADDTLKKCREKYLDVKYFAGKAFPDNKEALREFGEGQYSKVRNSHLRMVQFMETLHGVANKYKTQLIAQNYTQAAIDEIATLANELRTKNGEQQLQKKERPTETRKRIEALNLLYSFGPRVHEAAQVIYRNNSVLRDEFRLNMRHHPKVSKSWLSIGAGTVRKIALTKLLKKFNLTLLNQSKENTAYWRANSIRENVSEKQTLAAAQEIKIEAETPAKKFLLIQNTASKPVRVVLKKELKKKQ